MRTPNGLPGGRNYYSGVDETAIGKTVSVIGYKVSGLLLSIQHFPEYDNLPHMPSLCKVDIDGKECSYTKFQLKVA